jgi:hypothetical protein
MRLRNINISTRRRKALATFCAVMAAALAGLVLAAWLTDGTGPGRAQAGSLQPIVVSLASGTPTSGFLLPGGTGSGRFAVNNPNSTALKIVSAQAGGPIGLPSEGGTGASSNPLCPSSNVTVETLTGLNISLPASTTTDVTIPDVFRLAASAPTDCQGAEFQKSVKLTASTP